MDFGGRHKTTYIITHKTRWWLGVGGSEGGVGVYAAYLNLRVTVLRAEDILRLEVPAHTIVSTATRRTVQPRAAYLWTIPCECKKPSVVTSFRITSAAIGSLGAVIRVSCESKPEPKIARNSRVRPPVDHMVEQLASLAPPQNLAVRTPQ